ncbi:FAD-binding domain-containing protein [Dentipellis sp. KUC8613]|nr:FAD-binding domain-containing protein [Dentipellis sp. KUC8613]
MSDYASFKQAFKGDLLTPEHPEYEKSLERWAANSQRRAAVVAFVKDADDISLALKYAREHKLPIAVKGGGHNPAGSSSVEGGLVIDLSKYRNGARIDAEKKLAYIGGGALWETVDKAAIVHGLATAGGTVNHTGVGGLTLGGGYGFLSGEHGLVIDNLVQATVVAADGTVYVASATENPDLFWAIRGGGSNFGVVSEFVLKLHPQRRTVFAGLLVYPASALDQLMPLLAEKYRKGLKAKETFLQVITLGPDRNPCVVFIVFWNGSEEEGKANYKPFLDLNPIVNTCGEIPFERLNSLQNDKVPHGRNYYLKPIYQPGPDMEVAKKISQRIVELASAHSDVIEEIAFMYEFWPLDKICSVPEGETAFQRIRRLSGVTQIVFKENTEEQLKITRMVAQELVDITHTLKDNLPEDQNTGYANYNSDQVSLLATNEVTPTSKSEALFGGNLQRLAELKRKYDPEMVFSKWFTISPAVAP